MEKISYQTIFKETEYIKIICANIINRFGDSIDAIALTWLIYQLSNSPSLSALTYGINFLPSIILQPIAGAFVENKNKKNIMILCDILRGIIVTFIAIATMEKFIQPWMLIICTVLISTVESLRVPCGLSIVPLLLTEEKYSYGMSLSNTCSTVSELIGTAIAGVFIGLLGIGGAILIDTATFFLSALIIFFTKIPYVSSKHSSSTKQNFKEGLSYLFHNKIILTFCLVACYLNAVFVPLNSLQSALTIDVYHLDATVLSVLGISLTIGMGIGSFIYPMIAEKINIKVSILGCNFILGFFYFGCIFANQFTSNLFFFYLFISLICFIFGLSVTLMSSTISVNLLKIVNQNYISRIYGIFSAICVAAMPITSFILSGLTLFFSISQIFIGFGSFTLLVSIILFQLIPNTIEKQEN